VSAAGALAIACVWACLPVLSITPPPPVGPTCGDGIISPDAGESCDVGPDASLLALTACQSCTVKCGGDLPFLDRATHHCYFALPNTSEIDAAGASCEGNGAHVVRFVGEDEVSLVASSLVADHATGPYWVGLRDLANDGNWLPSEATDEPGWSAQCPGCFAHVDAGAADIPALPDGGRRCVEGYVADGSTVPDWRQTLCRGLGRLTLCEREPIGTRTVPCQLGGMDAGCFTVAATETEKSYALLPTKWSAADAVQHCSVFGGRLIVFRSREEREQVGLEIGTQNVLAGASDYWIGLAVGASGGWGWDGDAGGLDPPPWGLSQPPITVNARAYVLVAPGAIDSELARAQMTPAETHYALCELP
jgi:hypothetical protein